MTGIIKKISTLPTATALSSQSCPEGSFKGCAEASSKASAECLIEDCTKACTEAHTEAHTEAKPLYDLHCHLGFVAHTGSLATQLAQAGIRVLCATVEPGEYQRLRAAKTADSLTALGIGLHPWWVADGSCGEKELRACCDLMQETRFVAEIGLDFGPKYRAAQKVQLEVFKTLCKRAAQLGNKVLSIHSYKAAHSVLDILEESACLSQKDKTSPCIAILHWYSDSSEQLKRAIDLGCYFSLGERMLASRRGREYARQIPLHKLLLETDLPSQPCEDFDASLIVSSLRRALCILEELRGVSLQEILAQNSAVVLGEALL